MISVRGNGLLEALFLVVIHVGIRPGSYVGLPHNTPTAHIFLGLQAPSKFWK